MISQPDRSRAALGSGDPDGGRPDGLAMAMAGRGDAMGAHGWIVLLFAGVLFVVVGDALYEPEPSEDRLASYYDDPTKVGILLALIWAVVGMGMGVWVAAQLAWPEPALRRRLVELRAAAARAHLGRDLRLRRQRADRHVLPHHAAHQPRPDARTSSARGSCCWASTCSASWRPRGYLMGVTQSKEYAEPEWYADLWLVIVWVAYFVLYMRTLARRNEPHIYVANWYYLAFILVVAVLHIVNNLAVPASLSGGQELLGLLGRPGRDDPVVVRPQRGGLLPDRRAFWACSTTSCPSAPSGRSTPTGCRSCRFWGITFFYIWAGSHHLHYTALPHWVQTLGATFSVMLLVPVLGLGGQRADDAQRRVAQGARRRDACAS